jgi:RNA polymerase sigma factor (sigma-70 family)
MVGMGQVEKMRLTDENERAKLISEEKRLFPREVGMADEAASPDFAQLMLVHEPQLHRRARCFCRDADEARDLVQDTLVRALKHHLSLRPGSNVRGWLMTIMVNLYRDGLKKRRRKREVPLETWHDVADEPPAPPTHPPLERAQIDSAMARLPSDLRGLLEMKAIQGLRYRDIGERLSIPTNTVGTRLRRARKALCLLLGIATREDES